MSDGDENSGNIGKEPQMHAHMTTHKADIGGVESRDHRMDNQSVADLLRDLAEQMTTLSLFPDQAAWDALRDQALTTAEALTA
jgi:hypothetical protein